ncbi:3-isopropylmalate dehydratase large subunit [Acuticoccus kandeliae]|uniref:3-isopropylmalate dehydratase large subunit n=1 Tax=Acuticoccus kandeliae TaxID=2073160 RepID=UPI000D3EDFF7|nr:3-isopropylmalate dehydratase large subunit [Acuticoccus kandeliae]
MGLTLFDKLWQSHVIAERESDALLFVDRHFVHEGSFHAFDKVRARGERVARPDLTFGVADHYVPTRREGPIAEPEIRRMVDDLRANCAEHGIHLFGLDDPRQGIVHVVGPEQGIALPGLMIVCGDSHTATQGALGAYAFGIGATEVSHVLMTQTLWQTKPKRMRVTVDGVLSDAVAAKDVALSIIAKIGADGAAGHAVEYAGSAIRGLSMEGRMTLCNMTIEAGGRCGMVAPDETTLAYVRERPYAPADFDRAAADWLALASDAGAVFDREIRLDADAIAPSVTWGTSPEDTLPITATVPAPSDLPARADHVADALSYMGLTAGMPLDGLAIDRVFIGSCTNARLEDLRAAAQILHGRKAKVPGIVSPGSSIVKAQAEAEGLDRTFTAAGLEWRESGCSMCVGMNGDRGAPGERVASTTNRNFRGRQGRGVRTHLMSPAMVAAAAVAGAITDVRPLMRGPR